MRPNKVRSDFAKQKAQEYLTELCILTPPIKIKELANVYGKVKFNPEYDPGFTIKSPITGKFYFYINPRAVPGRVTWTIAHELAHVLLGHFDDFDINELLYSEELILDKEVDIFVREFLMPETWVRAGYEPPLTISKLAILKNTFNVSWTALLFRFNELGICKYTDIKKLFNMPKGTYVAELGGENYCTSEFVIKEVVVMSKPITFPEFDNNMRFTFCPICQNKTFSEYAKYCKKCGTYLYNECTNAEESYTGWCGEKNVPDALYCEHCGFITMIGQLITQQIEEKTNETKTFNLFNGDDIPF